MCVCGGAYVHVCVVCACTTADVNSRVCVRWYLIASFNSVHLLFWDKDPHQTWSSGLPRKSIQPSSQGWGYRHTPPHPAFTWVPRIWTQVLHVHSASLSDFTWPPDANFCVPDRSPGPHGSVLSRESSFIFHFRSTSTRPVWTRPPAAYHTCWVCSLAFAEFSD